MSATTGQATFPLLRMDFKDQVHSSSMFWLQGHIPTLGREEKTHDSAGTYPRKKGEKIVLLIVDDISRIPLVPLLGVPQPDSAGSGIPSTTASQPLTAPAGKTHHQDHAHTTQTTPKPPCTIIEATSILLRPHPDLPTHPRIFFSAHTLVGSSPNTGKQCGHF